MASWLPYAVATGCVIVVAKIWSQYRAGIRADYVRQFTLPQGIFDKLRIKHPELSTKECQLIAQALRQFFLAYLKGGFRPISMPSQIADDLWHELILYTRVYERFCSKAFGRFLHHTPAAALGSAAAQDEGLRRCWRLVCREEGINPKKPTRLPLLFAIDGKLNIPGGFRYVPDCGQLGKTDKDGQPVHCGSHVGTGCGAGGGGIFDSIGAGDSSGDSGCSGGGCGGD